MSRTWVSTLIMLAIVAGMLITPQRVGAAAPTAEDGLRVSARANAVTLQWNSPVGGAVRAAALPKVEYGGYLLPMQLITVQPVAGVQPAITLVDLESIPWTGRLETAPVEMPAALGWEPIPALLPKTDGRLPDAPVFVLRQGRLRSVEITVLAFSPIFQDPASSKLRQVQSMEVRIDQAGLAPALDKLGDARPPVGVGISAAAAPQPNNPLAGGTAVKLYVEHAGIQAVSAAALAEAGLTGPNAARLRLFLRGVEIPLEIVDTDGNGVLDGAGDLLRFYAGQPSDRWNPADLYWLVVGDRPGLRIAERVVTPEGAPVSGVGLELGVWAQNHIYQSLFAGADGDHWFHSNAVTEPALQSDPNKYPTFSLLLNHKLPAATGANLPAQLTFATTAYDVRGVGSGLPAVTPFQLELRSKAFTLTDDADDWIVDFGQGEIQNLTRTISLPAPATALSVTLMATEYANGLLFDTVAWQLPVQLQFGERGATFGGRSGEWTYSLTGLPAGAALYDISNPLRPQRLVTAPKITAAFLPFISGVSGSATSSMTAARVQAENLQFQDGPQARQYLVTGTGTVYTPRAVAHSGVSFDRPGAQAIYIGPADFAEAIQPLLAQRESQGYTATYVDIQDIYDAWSFGMVSPQAIRDFLRYAVETWQPAPIAAVLVGDGTRDPYDHSHYGGIRNVIPPYLADVDPWLGEAPCDNCYAQLDGDDPLSESAFFMDIWLGRFPAVSVDEVKTIVDKILAYENAEDRSAPWRGQAVQLADDYLRADGTFDPAGNFPAFAEGIVGLQPAKITSERNYYNAPFDPATLPDDVAAFYGQIAPWVESDPATVLKKSIAYLNRGAGFVTYTGHAHHWQWGVTDRADPDGRLFGLWDIGSLTNRDRLFIGLSMTCYTSQFDVPAPYHYTLDENLVLFPGGGAVATWGPAGLSVSHGHDAIQQGFYQALWQAKPMEAKLGALVQAGYTFLLTQRSCCQDIPHTFTLLGDPLTPARVQPLDALYLPSLER